MGTFYRCTLTVHKAEGSRQLSQDDEESIWNDGCVEVIGTKDLYVLSLTLPLPNTVLHLCHPSAPQNSSNPQPKIPADVLHRPHIWKENKPCRNMDELHFVVLLTRAMNHGTECSSGKMVCTRVKSERQAQLSSQTTGPTTSSRAVP